MPRKAKPLTLDVSKFANPRLTLDNLLDSTKLRPEGDYNVHDALVDRLEACFSATNGADLPVVANSDGFYSFVSFAGKVKVVYASIAAILAAVAFDKPRVEELVYVIEVDDNGVSYHDASPILLPLADVVGNDEWAPLSEPFKALVISMEDDGVENLPKLSKAQIKALLKQGEPAPAEPQNQ
jgi:hypothetical protein